jgi:hypothetical protein
MLPCRDMNAIAFNSSGVSLVHFLCTWISRYSLLPGKVENAKIKSLKVIITELGKLCQEMARIEGLRLSSRSFCGPSAATRPFAQLFSPGSLRRLSVFVSFKKESSYGHDCPCARRFHLKFSYIFCFSVVFIWLDTFSSVRLNWFQLCHKLIRL